MLIELLKSEELEMADTYRRWYGWSNDANHNRSGYEPMTNILQVWEKNKSEYLYKLFGDSLTLTKRIKYAKSYEELQNAISDMVQEHSQYGRIGRNGYEFANAWRDYVYDNRHTLTYEQKECLHRIMSDDCLINNSYDGMLAEFDLPNGKKYRVSRGAKTSKALGKLAAIFNLPGYEDFRICLSQILNQKELGGDLTISIHPLDYMTMSDNTYCWESCMSWENEGGYRQGTVEMMNSRSVIVAYLAGDDTYSIHPYEWNSKKWRQLFVVDHNVIVGVKDYPYHNDELSRMIVEWLRELVKEKLGWTYSDPQEFKPGHQVHAGYLPAAKDDFFIEFKSNNMYNDFGCLDYHWLCLSDDIDVEEIHGHHPKDSSRDYNRVWLPVEYSGPSQCMICGDTHPDLEDESCLACQECQDRDRCDCCGEIASQTWYIDGMRLCEYCWENRVHTCAGCGDEHYDDNLRPVFIIPRLTPEKTEELRRLFVDGEGRYWSCGFCNTREELDQADYNYFNDDNPSLWICDDRSECMEKWIESYLKPGERPHLREWRWSKEVCIYADQLNDDGLEEFLWGYDQDSVADYVKRFRSYHINPTRFIKLL